MAHYIDKDAVVAEIDERIKAWKEYYDEMHDAGCHELASGAYLRMRELKDLKKFLDTLEVKEVDLESEIDSVEDRYYGFESLSRADIIDIAKYFFELGLKVKQG